MTRSARFAPIACFALLTFVAPAHASSLSIDGARITARSDVRSIGPSTKRFTTTLTIKTGSRPLRRWFSPQSPRFKRHVQGLDILEAATLKLVSVKRRGPAIEWGSGDEELKWFGLCYRSPRLHGTSSTADYRELKIPAHATQRLVYTFAVAADSTWNNTSYTPSFAIAKKFDEGRFQMIDPLILRPAAIPVRRRVASRVDLDLSPRLALTEAPGFFTWLEGSVAAGAPVQISGRVVPARPGAEVSVLQQGDFRNPFTLIGTAQTDASGSFTLAAPWVPTESATLKTVLGSAAAPEDESCPVGVDVPAP